MKILFNISKITQKFGFLLIFAILPLGVYGQYVEGDSAVIVQESTTDLSAKQNTARGWKDKLYYGGNFSFMLGNIQSMVEISPLLGWSLTPAFSVGTGLTYMYYNFKYSMGGRQMSSSANVFGARMFSRLRISKNFFAHGEYESLRVEYFNSITGQKERRQVPATLIGAGYFQSFNNSDQGMTLTVLYNLDGNNPYSPYASPLVIRAGIVLRLK